MIRLLFLILLLTGCASVPRPVTLPAPPPSPVEPCRINPNYPCDNVEISGAMGRGVSQ